MITLLGVASVGVTSRRHRMTAI